MKPTTSPLVAVVQNLWRDSPQENRENVLQMVRSVPTPVHLICLPEFFLGAPFYFPGRAHLRGIIDQPIPGPLTSELGQLAREKGCYILAGTVVEREGDRYYNTSVLIDDRGEICGKARKLHRFAAEMVTVTAGDQQLLVDTPFGRLGLCVCSDFWIVEMPRLLALRGAEIIAVPGAALVNNLPITRPCIQANSAFNVCYTLFAGVVGTASGERAGRKASIELGGCTTIAGPEQLLGSLGDEEAILYRQLDQSYLRQMRAVDLSFKRSLYFCLHGRVPELYGGITSHYVGRAPLETLIGDYLNPRGPHAV